jgi:hypothetical protein
VRVGELKCKFIVTRTSDAAPPKVDLRALFAPTK